MVRGGRLQGQRRLTGRTGPGEVRADPAVPARHECGGGRLGTEEMARPKDPAAGAGTPHTQGHSQCPVKRRCAVPPMRPAMHCLAIYELTADRAWPNGQKEYGWRLAWPVRDYDAARSRRGTAGEPPAPARWLRCPRGWVNSAFVLAIPSTGTCSSDYRPRRIRAGRD